MKQQQEHVRCRLVRSAGSRALPARPYLRYPRAGAPALIPQSSLPSARAWARAETARRRRFPFPRADAGVGRRGLGARACAELRPGCPRGGAERGGAEQGGAEAGGDPRAAVAAPAVLGNRKWAAAVAVALAETAAAGPGPRGAGTGRGPPERGERRSRRGGRDRCRAKSDKVSGGQRTCVSSGTVAPGESRTVPGPLPCSLRGCRGSDPRQPGRAPG